MRRILWLYLIFALVFTGSALAQETSGTINGKVTDQQGAVIPGASVTATHTATNTVYTATTGAVGKFTIPTVRLGRYRIGVETEGFRRGVVENVLVEVGQTSTVNVSLQIGIVTEEIIVEAGDAQQIINTTNAELSTVVDSDRIADLPLDGRNASHLVLMQAGVNFERTASGQGDKLFVHGQRHSSLSITLDGNDTQDNFNRASSIMIDQPLIALSAENVQEFKIGTGNTSAEYGRGGAHISAVTKSGTNELHGAIFYYHRNNATSSNEFFNSGLGLEVPKLIRNQFGGGIGGSIIEDKTFFYFGYQQTRLSQGIPQNRVVWTPEARQGLFRWMDGGILREVNLLDCTGLTDCFADNYLSTGAYVSGGQFTQDPFISGTVIPEMPLPNSDILGDGLNLRTYRFNARSQTFEHLPTLRIDHKISDMHSFFGTANYTDRNIVGDFINGRLPVWPNLGALGRRTTLSKAFSGTVRSALAATMINEVRVGVTLGENAFPRQQPFNTPFTLDFDDIGDPYSVGGHIGTARDNETWHVRETFSWVRGSHNLKMGAEFRHRWVRNVSWLNNEPWGEIDFNDSDNAPGFSSSNIIAAAGATGISSSNFNNAEELFNNLVGAIGDVEAQYNFANIGDTFFTVGEPELRRWSNDELDFFFNDTWQFNSQLTINLGLRWEYASVPDESNGLIYIPDFGQDAIYGVSGQAGFFNPGTFAGHGCDAAIFPFDLATVFAGGGPVLSNANVQAMVNGCATPNTFGGGKNGRPLWNTDTDNFAPVVSLAWDPLGDQKMAVRAGYRISYYQDHFAMVEDHVDDNEGLRVFLTCEPSDASIACQNPTTPNRENALLRNLTGPPLPVVPALSDPFRATFYQSTSQDFRTYIDDLETPYYQEWNVGVSREIWENSAIEVRYVGNRGLKQRRVADWNEINVNAFDATTGMSFMDAFLIAQSNLACNRANSGGNDYTSTINGAAAGCITANPLMADLIASEESYLDSRGNLLEALDRNAAGDFAWHLTIEETSRIGSGEGRIRGGAFWGQVLVGRFPANFFLVNPFVASSRAMTNDGRSTYHAMEVEFKRRMSNGFTFQANYTLGKAEADYDGDSNTLVNDVRPSSVVNRDYTLQEYMPRHMFNANWLYELPIGSGRAVEFTQPVLDKILGGWQFGGIMRSRSGRPLSIFSGVGSFHREAISDQNTVNLSQPMSGSQLGALTGRQSNGGALYWIDPCTSSELPTPGPCFDPNAIANLFGVPNPGELGELSLTPITGPPRFTVDVNLLKTIQITEGYELEFRWDMFNLTNTANFVLPENNIFSQNFGRISNTNVNPRIMQFSLRLSF